MAQCGDFRFRGSQQLDHKHKFLPSSASTSRLVEVQLFLHAHSTPITMMTAMSHTCTVGSHVCATAARSQRKPALVSRRVAGVRRSFIRRAAKDGQGNTPGLPRPNLNEGTEQTNDVAEPKVDQSKVQNIAAGNISNDNAEKRADIGATRPPTLFGELKFLDRRCWRPRCR